MATEAACGGWADKKVHSEPSLGGYSVDDEGRHGSSGPGSNSHVRSGGAVVRKIKNKSSYILFHQRFNFDFRASQMVSRIRKDISRKLAGPATQEFHENLRWKDTNEAPFPCSQ